MLAWVVAAASILVIFADATSVLHLQVHQGDKQYQIAFDTSGCVSDECLLSEARAFCAEHLELGGQIFCPKQILKAAKDLIAQHSSPGSVDEPRIPTGKAPQHCSSHGKGECSVSEFENSNDSGGNNPVEPVSNSWSNDVVSLLAVFTIVSGVSCLLWGFQYDKASTFEHIMLYFLMT
eukprot:g4650.t1